MESSDDEEGPPRQRQRIRYRQQLLPRTDGRVGRVTRKLKLSSFLNDDYKHLQERIRFVAEKYHVMKRDAVNLANLHVRRWVESENGFNFPPITTRSFWSKAFRVANDRVSVVSRRLDPGWQQDLLDTFTDHFYSLRRDAVTNQSLYQVNQVRDVYVALADAFPTQIIQNVKRHLVTNVPVYMKAVWRAYFIQLKERIQRALPGGGPAGHADTAVAHIMNHQPLQDNMWEQMPFRDELAEFYRIQHELYERHLAGVEMDELDPEDDEAVPLLPHI
ncbi:hypothetical protein DFQ28_003243, partial [Apophysomyces sp. BC1034]